MIIQEQKRRRGRRWDMDRDREVRIL